jgi:hypothetical protein
MAPRESRAPPTAAEARHLDGPSTTTRARAVSPIRRNRPAVSHCHITRGLERSCRCSRHHERQGGFDPCVRASPLVAHPGALHPPARIDRLAPDDRLARPSLRQPRRHADQRRHLARLGPTGLPGGACVGIATPAARRRLPHLDGERAPVRRRPVAPLLVRLWRRMTTLTGRVAAARATAPAPPATRGPVADPAPRPGVPSRGTAPTRARTGAAGA